MSKYKIIIYPDIYPLKEVIKFLWKHFKDAINIKSDNLNLGLHEFTHVLHFESKKAQHLRLFV